MRLQLVGQYSNRDTSNYLPVLPGSYQRRWQALGYVGYEWQRRISRHWGYGLEVEGGLTRQDRRRAKKGTNDLGH